MTNGAISTSHPTTSDISMFMRDFNYEWSNQAQIYFYNIPCKCLPRHDTIQTINRVTAEHMYKSLIGDKPYERHNKYMDIDNKKRTKRLEENRPWNKDCIILDCDVWHPNGYHMNTSNEQVVIKSSKITLNEHNK